MTDKDHDRRIVMVSPDIVSRNIAGEHLFVPVRQGTAEMDFIYTANAVGSLIFSLLDGRRDALAIARLVRESFDISERQAREDVRQFLQTLCDAGLVRPVENACARPGERTMTRDEVAGGQKRHYKTPQLTRVRLVPDEAVLTSCKNNATVGPTGSAKECAGPPAPWSHNAS